MSDEQLSINTVMKNTPKFFKPEAAKGVSAVVQFDFTGREASKWVGTIENQECTVVEGTTGSPTMTMTVDSDDYLQIISGKMNAMNAFMQGKVRIKGDMSLAMKFPNFFSMG